MTHELNEYDPAIVNSLATGLVKNNASKSAAEVAELAKSRLKAFFGDPPSPWAGSGGSHFVLNITGDNINFRDVLRLGNKKKFQKGFKEELMYGSEEAINVISYRAQYYIMQGNNRVIGARDFGNLEKINVRLYSPEEFKAAHGVDFRPWGVDPYTGKRN